MRYTDKFTPTHKWCNHCKAMLPHSMFHGNVTNRTGLQGYCKEWNRLYVEGRREAKAGRRA